MHETAAKHGEEVAQEIVERKLQDPDLCQTEVRQHPEVNPARKACSRAVLLHHGVPQQLSQRHGSVDCVHGTVWPCALCGRLTRCKSLHFSGARTKKSLTRLPAEEKKEYRTNGELDASKYPNSDLSLVAKSEQDLHRGSGGCLVVLGEGGCRKLLQDSGATLLEASALEIDPGWWRRT